MRIDEQFFRVEQDVLDRVSDQGTPSDLTQAEFLQAVGSIQSAFDALNISAVLLTEDGRVCGRTRGTYQDWCEGLVAFRGDGVFGIDHDKDRQLQAIIAEMSADKSIAIRWAYWIDRASGKKFTVKCFRVPHEAQREFSTPTMILTIRPLVAISQADAGKLSKILGLTVAEGEILVMLYEGLTRRDIAAARGTTTHTVASQLKTIFMKCGVRREAELVALVASLSGIWAFAAF